MCKRRFLDIDILGPTCQLSLGQERSGEHRRKKYWQSLSTIVTVKQTPDNTHTSTHAKYFAGLSRPPPICNPNPTLAITPNVRWSGLPDQIAAFHRILWKSVE